MSDVTITYDIAALGSKDKSAIVWSRLVDGKIYVEDTATFHNPEVCMEVVRRWNEEASLREALEGILAVCEDWTDYEPDASPKARLANELWNIAAVALSPRGN